MIIALEEAKTHNPNITQDDLDGLETMIRELTHNNFQNRNIRLQNQVKFESNKITSNSSLLGFESGKTVQVSESLYNDGLYVIQEVGDDCLIVEANFTNCLALDAYVTLIEYPADIKNGVKKLLKYDAKMSDKLGIKSEQVSRWTTTYYDVNSTESSEGYPASLLKFLDKYRKLRW